MYARGFKFYRTAIKENSELVDAFNSDLSDNEFEAMLKSYRAKSPKSVNQFIGRIRKLANIKEEDDEQ